MVLCLVIEDVVAVAHIHVKHTVVCVGPYDGEVAAGDDILEADGIVFRREGEKNLHISVETRAWTPVVPLVSRRGKCRRQAFCRWMSAVIHDEFCGERRPVVTVEDASTEEVDEPGPMRTTIVVC